MACNSCKTGFRQPNVNNSRTSATLMSRVALAEGCIASIPPPNVYEINDVGRRKKAVCFAPVGALVKGDVMLAQKIALETDEQNALTVANVTPGLHWII